MIKCFELDETKNREQLYLGVCYRVSMQSLQFFIRKGRKIFYFNPRSIQVKTLEKLRYFLIFLVRPNNIVHDLKSVFKDEAERQKQNFVCYKCKHKSETHCELTFENSPNNLVICLKYQKNSANQTFLQEIKFENFHYSLYGIIVHKVHKKFIYYIN